MLKFWREVWRQTLGRVTIDLHLRGHWGRKNRDAIRHGPQSWPWWVAVSYLRCTISAAPPSLGRRLWVYTRWGAFFIDFYVDARERANAQD